MKKKKKNDKCFKSRKPPSFTRFKNIQSFTANSSTCTKRLIAKL